MKEIRDIVIIVLLAVLTVAVLDVLVITHLQQARDAEMTIDPPSEDDLPPPGTRT